jgi:hypothetical protein
MKLTLPGDGHITAFIYILQITSNNNGPAVAATGTTLREDVLDNMKRRGVMRDAGIHFHFFMPPLIKGAMGDFLTNVQQTFRSAVSPFKRSAYL